MADHKISSISSEGKDSFDQAKPLPSPFRLSQPTITANSQNALITETPSLLELRQNNPQDCSNLIIASVDRATVEISRTIIRMNATFSQQLQEASISASNGIKSAQGSASSTIAAVVQSASIATSSAFSRVNVAQLAVTSASSSLTLANLALSSASQSIFMANLQVASVSSASSSEVSVLSSSLAMLQASLISASTALVAAQSSIASLPQSGVSVGLSSTLTPTQVAAIVVGAAVTLTLLAAAIYFLFNRSKKKEVRDRYPDEKDVPTSPKVFPPRSSSTSRTSTPMRIKFNPPKSSDARAPSRSALRRPKMLSFKLPHKDLVPEQEIKPDVETFSITHTSLPPNWPLTPLVAKEEESERSSTLPLDSSGWHIDLRDGELTNIPRAIDSSSASQKQPSAEYPTFGHEQDTIGVEQAIRSQASSLYITDLPGQFSVNAIGDFVTQPGPPKPNIPIKPSTSPLALDPSSEISNAESLELSTAPQVEDFDTNVGDSTTTNNNERRDSGLNIEQLLPTRSERVPASGILKLLHKDEARSEDANETRTSTVPEIDILIHLVAQQNESIRNKPLFWSDFRPADLEVEEAIALSALGNEVPAKGGRVLEAKRRQETELILAEKLSTKEDRNAMFVTENENGGQVNNISTYDKGLEPDILKVEESLISDDITKPKEETDNQNQERGRSMIRTSDIIEIRYSGIAKEVINSAKSSQKGDEAKELGRNESPLRRNPISPARSVEGRQNQIVSPFVQDPIIISESESQSKSVLPPLSFPDIHLASTASTSIHEKFLEQRNRTVSPLRRNPVTKFNIKRHSRSLSPPPLVDTALLKSFSHTTREASPLRRNPISKGISTRSKSSSSSGSRMSERTQDRPQLKHENFLQALSKFEKMVEQNPSMSMAASSEVTSRAIAGIYIPGSLREQAVRNSSKSRERSS